MGVRQIPRNAGNSVVNFFKNVWKGSSVNFEAGPGAKLKIGTNDYGVDAGAKVVAEVNMSPEQEKITTTTDVSATLNVNGSKVGYQFYKQQIQKTSSTHSDGYTLVETEVLKSEGFKRIGQLGAGNAAFTDNNAFQVELNTPLGGVKYSLDLGVFGNNGKP